MGDLYFFPVNPAEWLAGEATSAMTPTQEGAFFRLLCRQWMSSELPCSLPNDDTKLAQLSRLGSDWPTVGAFVREQFEEVKGDATRLRNPKLWAIWREKQASHKRRVNAGKQGGDAKAKRYQSSSNATAIPSNKSKSNNKKPRGGWVARFGEPFTKSSGGIAPLAEIGRFCKPLVDRDGEEKTYARWDTFCASEKRQFGAAYFAKHAGDFDPGKPVGKNGKLGNETAADYQFRKRGYVLP